MLSSASQPNIFTGNQVLEASYAKFLVWQRCHYEYKLRYIEGLNATLAPRDSETLLGTITHHVISELLKLPYTQRDQQQAKTLAAATLARYGLTGSLLEQAKLTLRQALVNFFSLGWSPEGTIHSELSAQSWLLDDMRLSTRIDCYLDNGHGIATLIEFKTFSLDWLLPLHIDVFTQSYFSLLALPSHLQDVVTQLRLRILLTGEEHVEAVTKPRTLQFRQLLEDWARQVRSEREFKSTCGGVCNACKSS